MGYTRLEWAIGSMIIWAQFFCAICVSIQAPFYPQEAEKKGATATEYGLVFGIFELVAFIGGPVIGKYLSSVGVKKTMYLGITLAGICTVFFGLLDMFNSHNWFISLSFVLRIFESLGATSTLIASFSLSALVFPDSIATIFAYIETTNGVGLIVGPAIGGVLYQLGGFMCPFLVLGSCMLLNGVIIFFVLRFMEADDNVKNPRVSIISVLRLPPVIFDMISILVAAMTAGYYTATLGPHLKEFNLSPIETGAMFIINAGFYTITAPLVGRLCNIGMRLHYLVLLGCVFFVVSFGLVGPLPFLPLNNTLWMCCVGLVFHGLGQACIFVPAFMDALRSAVSYGLPDDISTYGIVSGLWTSSFALGGFIGPSAAGFLYDMVGFRKGTLFVIAVVILLFCAISTFICWDKRRETRNDISGSPSCSNGGDVSGTHALLPEGTTMSGYGSIENSTSDTGKLMITSTI